MKISFALSAVAVVVTAGIGCSHGSGESANATQAHPTATAHNANAVNPMAMATDRAQAVDQLAAADQTQIALGQLALSKSQNSHVQQVAQRIAQDHAQHLMDLQAWARSRNIPVSSRQLNTDSAVG